MKITEDALRKGQLEEELDGVNVTELLTGRLTRVCCVPEENAELGAGRPGENRDRGICPKIEPVGIFPEAVSGIWKM